MRDALDSRHARQFDVHEHDIGLHDVNPIQGVFTADTSPDEAHVVGGSQDLGELLAQPPVIFDNRHFLDHTSHADPSCATCRPPAIAESGDSHLSRCGFPHRQVQTNRRPNGSPAFDGEISADVLHPSLQVAQPMSL